MTLHSESNITCTTRLVLASIFLAAAWVSAAGQTNTNTFPGIGNAGIGTTSPGDALQIVKDNGGLTLDTATSGTIVPVFRFSTTGTGRASIQYRPDLPGLAFQTGGIAYPAQNRMVLTDSGNFGIGTTNPAVKLHSQVSSPNTGTPTGSDMGMFINNSNTTANNYALIGFGNAFPQFQAAIGSVNLASGANAGGHLVFHTRPAAGATAERMRIDSSGNVGIGTTAPGGKVHIYDLTAGLELIGRIQHADDSSASSNSIWRVISGNLGTSKLEFTSSSFWRAAIWSGANKDLQFYTGGQPSAATERMRILDTGTIGIGLSNPNTSYKLDVNGAINATALNVNGSPIISTQWMNGSGNINYTSGNVGIGTTIPQRTLDLGTSGQLTFGNNGYSSTASPGFFWSTDNVNYGIYKSAGSWSAPNYQQLTVNFPTGIVIDGGSAYGKSGTVLQPNGGNVGIGTNAPTQKLEVAGTGLFKGTTLTSTGAGTYILDQNIISLNGVNARDLSVQAQNLKFFTGTTYAEKMRLDVNGNLGIGRTDPGFKLDVNGEINATGIRINGTPISSGVSSQWSGTSGNPISYNVGNVGIGTPTPTALLSVSKNQASGTEIRIDNGNAAGFAGLYMNGGFAGATGGFVQYNNVTGFRNLFVGTAGSEPLHLGTENSVRVTVLPGSGNVGIGKSDPQYKLDVVGDIKASGTIHAKYQDLAEWVPSSEQLAAGTVVVLDTTKSNQVIASGTAYDTRVAGVISTQPGITLGESGEGKVLVATTGRVRVKVDASRGPIQIGDLLVTSEVAGVAMKSEPVEFAGRKMHMPGTIIGKALEPLAKGSGEILVLLSLQ